MNCFIIALVFSIQHFFVVIQLFEQPQLFAKYIQAIIITSIVENCLVLPIKMNSAPIPPLRKSFWDANKRFLKIGTSGKVYYTDEGKAQFRPLFSRYGYSLENVQTLDDFRRVMRDINAHQLNENNDRLRQLLHDPATSDVERAAIAEILGVSAPPAPPTPANVVMLSDWRQKRKDTPGTSG